MAIPRIVKGLGRKLGAGVWGMAVSALYDKLKDRSIDLFGYIKNQRVSDGRGSTATIGEQLTPGLEGRLDDYAANITEEGRRDLSYLSRLVDYAKRNITEDGRLKPGTAESWIYALSKKIEDVSHKISNYDIRRYMGIGQRANYAGDSQAHLDYVGNFLHGLERVVDWADNLDEAKKRFVHQGITRGVRWFYREKIGIPEPHLDRIVDSTLKGLGKLKDAASTSLREYNARSPNYTSDFSPYTHAVYGTASA